MTNIVDPDQTAPKGAVRSGSTLFASILRLVGNIGLLFAAEDIFRCIFVGALRPFIFALITPNEGVPPDPHLECVFYQMPQGRLCSFFGKQ